MQTKFIPQEILDRITWIKQGHLKGDPLHVESIRHEPKPCEDCDRTVENRRVQIRHHTSPQPHFRRKCLNCKLYYNNLTKQYDLESTEVLAFFRTYFCKRDK